MIISTGMRTDIPAFYSEWLINRIKEGFVLVRNPYEPKRVTRYELNPKIVDCITFCTKNPLPIIDKLHLLKDFRQFWFITLTPYGKNLEPNVPEKDKIINAFKKLSEILGKNAVGWRYDPILFDDEFNVEKHIYSFEKTAKSLKGYTDLCVISFLDVYQKVKRNAPNIYTPSFKEQKELGRAFAKIAKDNGITIRSCCEGTHLKEFGIDVSGCQTKEVIERAANIRLDVSKKSSQRGVCDCLLGKDIGAYDSCAHLCKYCYANSDARKVIENVKRHDPLSPFLIGNYEKGDIITNADQKSFISIQQSMF